MGILWLLIFEEHQPTIPCVEDVEQEAFYECTGLTDMKFSSNLEGIWELVFSKCRSLERITIPFKDDLFADDNIIFKACENLKHVDLVEEGELHETIAALHLEDWRNDMNEKIDSINFILPNAPAGSSAHDDVDVGEKARVIRRWIRSVLDKINYYKAEHERILDQEVATTLGLFLQAEIVMNNVLPFLALPLHTFEMEEEEDEEDYESDEEEYWEEENYD